MALESYMKTLIGPSSQVVIVDDNITTWLSLHGDDDKHEISSCHDSFRNISNDLTDKRSQIVDPTAMNASFSRTSCPLSPQSTTATHQHLHILETPPLPSLTVRRR